MKRFPLVSFAESRPSAHTEFNPFCVKPSQVLQKGAVRYPINGAAFVAPDKTDFVGQENMSRVVSDGLHSLGAAMDAQKAAAAVTTNPPSNSAPAE